MKLSIVVCAYNECDTIEIVLDQIQQVDLGAGWSKEVIAVDNMSTDGTREILARRTWPDTRVIFNERNLGKGGSIRAAIDVFTGDYFVIQDADLEYHPNQLVRLVQAVQEYDAVAVLGSRVLDGDARYHYWHAYLGVRVLSWLTNFLYGSHLTDVATAIKLVRADVLRQLNLVGSGFDLDFEIVNKLLLAGYSIHEVGLDYHPRTYAEGKKIRVRDGLHGMWIIVRDRLGLTDVLRPHVESQAERTRGGGD
ncbi:MAG: glycosyltransferase family 2 protein [Anaerolineales bacterium]